MHKNINLDKQKYAAFTRANTVKAKLFVLKLLLTATEDVRNVLFFER